MQQHCAPAPATTFATIGVVPSAQHYQMSRCFRAILSHWAETPEEVSEGRWSKSDSKQPRIDVAAVGTDVAAAPSVTESRLLLQPKLESRLGHSSPKGRSCCCWQSSRRLARFARPRVDELPSPSMRARVCQSPGGGRYCPGRGSGSPVGSGNGPNIGPGRTMWSCVSWPID